MGRNGHNNVTPLYRVRFREIGVGRDGGLGDQKSCKMRLRDPNQANQKLRKHAIIVSVRQIK